MKILLVVIITFFSTAMMAQYAETMRTARPGKSVGAFTVGKNILQFQQGIGFQERNEEQIIYRNIFSDYYSSNVVRYGISRKFEISALIDYSYITRRNTFGNEQNLEWHEFRNLDIGGRYNILEGLNGGLAWGIQARLGLEPTISVGDYPIFKIATSLTKRFKYFTVMGNLGFNQSSTAMDQLFYSLQLRIPVAKDMGIMLETYDTYSVSRYANDYSFYPYIVAGFWYYLNNDLQLDIHGGYRQTDSQFYFHSFLYVETGISWRLNFNN